MDEQFFNLDELLKPEIMISLYAKGLFPMADETGEVDWYMPETRTIIPLDNYNIPKSLRKFMMNDPFEYRYDNDVMTVVKECSYRKETWISDKLINAYSNLNDLGFLHSVEVYENNDLVGGLYGVSYKGAFFGESMFSKVSQASKCALAKLLERLTTNNFVLLDVQYETDHLNMFGATQVHMEVYKELLEQSENVSADFNGDLTAP